MLFQMATTDTDATRLTQTLGHLSLETRPPTNELTISNILSLPVFTSIHFPRLDELSLQPRPCRVRLNLTIHDALVLEALADSPLRTEIKSLELQPGPILPAYKAVHNMLDVLKTVLPRLSGLQHVHYVEELSQIMQINADLTRALFATDHLRHLVLSRFTVNNNLDLSEALPIGSRWGLNTITLVQFRTGGDHYQTKSFLTDLLMSARKSVRALTLDVEELVIPSFADEHSEIPVFPMLEHVVLKNAKMTAETAEVIYTSPHLRSISLSPHDDVFQDDDFNLNYVVPATCLNISNWGSTRASKSRSRLEGFIKENTHITHVNIRPVPNSRIADVIMEDMILAPLAHYNKACVSLSASAGPGLVSPATFLYLSDMRKLERVRLEVQPQTSSPVPIVHGDVMTQLQSLTHLRCLIIDGHVESRLTMKTWQDEALDRSQEEYRLTTIKDDLLALAATYAITFPNLQVLGIEHCWFEFDTVAGVSTLVKALFEPAVVAKEPYALKALFRVDEQLTV
jgi:hypothetical protein